MKIALLGDIALFGANSSLKNEHIEKRFQGLKEKLTHFDLIIGNLETPLTKNNKTCGGKSAYIKGLTSDVEILKYLGIKYVSLANNHMFDYGKEGFEETCNVLNAAGINHFGVNGKDLKVIKNNEKICLNGYCCYSTNAVGLNNNKDSYGINTFAPELIEKKLFQDKADGFFSILSVHWGQEHTHLPNYDHLTVSRLLANKNDFILHGHHPHVLQGIERYNNSLIAYSLGNLCFDDVYTQKSKEPLIKLSKDNKQSVILSIDIENSQIMNFNTIPFTFEPGVYSFDNDSNKEILLNLKVWSKDLQTDKNTYKLNRANFLNDYYKSRKIMRNFEWYIKRISIESLINIINSRRNMKKYSYYVNNYILNRSDSHNNA